MLQTPNELRKELSPAVMRRLEEIVAAVNRLEQSLMQMPAVAPQVTPQQVTEAVRGLIGIYGQSILGDNSAADPELTEVGTSPGSVSSVGLAVPTQFSVAGSPVTGTGTLTISWNTQTANTILAGPTGGAAAVPTFRALDSADFPATLNIATAIQVASTQVVSTRKTGWGAASGTLSRAAYASYAGQNVSAAYVEAEAQATDDAVKLLAQVVAALITDLTSHGLIGP